MELVERGAYLAALGEHLDVARAGHGRLVLVGGEAGVGKTSLVRAFANVHGRDVRVLWGACDGMFTPEPLGPVRDFADQAGGQLASALVPEAERLEVFTAVLAELGARPTVAVLEDVHWADEATLDLLRFVGRRLERTASLMIATYRDDEVGAQHPLRVVLGDLVTLENAWRIALPALSEAGVRTLAAGSDVDPVVLHRQTGGNPFFVTEVLAAGDTGVPSTVRDAVLARAARLQHPARAVLDAAAVIGMVAELELLEAVLDAPPRSIEECLSAGVLQAAEGGVAFRHELARRAVEEAIEPLQLSQLHERALQALSARGAREPARLAHHAEAAGDRAAVLQHARAAAQEAAALGARREAAAQYARALRFAEGLPDAHVADLLEARSYQCYLADQVEEAVAALEDALGRYRALGDRLKEGAALTSLARTIYLASRPDEAEAAARQAVTVLEALTPGPELAGAYAAMAQLAWIDLDEQGARSWGERAIALASELGERQVELNALATVGMVEGLAGRGTAKIEESLARSLEAGAEDDAARAYGGLCFIASRHRDWAAIDRWLDEGLAYVTERDLDHWRGYLLGWRAWASLERGRWDDAAADAQAGLANPDARLTRVWPLLALAALRARRGDPGAWNVLDEALERARNESSQKRVPLTTLRAETAFLAGDPGRALAELGSMPVVALVDRWIAGRLAVWRRRLGAAPEETGPLPEAYALELAGEHAAAAARWAELDCPYESALALAWSDDEKDLRRSHEQLLALGARPAAAIVARRLRERGARGVSRGPRPATRANPAGLTPRELEVLELLVEGLRNAEIAERLVISEKTAGHHVSSILRKLGVRSRSDAARAAAALQDREPAAPR